MTSINYSWCLQLLLWHFSVRREEWIVLIDIAKEFIKRNKKI